MIDLTRPAKFRLALDCYEQGILVIALMEFIRTTDGTSSPFWDTPPGLDAARSLLDRVCP